jgi:sec-independent protein translocase protein TatA
MPGNIGWPGLVVILLVLLLVFGPKRLPEMGRSLGRGMREFKDSITGNDGDEPEKTELAAPAPESTRVGATQAPAPAPPPAATQPAGSTQPDSERVSS